MTPLAAFQNFIEESIANPQQKALLLAPVWDDFQQIAQDPRTKASSYGTQLNITFKCVTPYLDEFCYNLNNKDYWINGAISLEGLSTTFEYMNLRKYLIVNNQLQTSDISYLKYSKFTKFLKDHPVSLPESFQNFMIL